MKSKHQTKSIQSDSQPLRLADIDDGAEAAEDFLTMEGPANDRRDRISPEYKSGVPQAPAEVSAQPDGLETYPDEKAVHRARGENAAGSSQRESQVKTLGIPPGSQNPLKPAHK